jgi:hypothetical protein
VRFVITGEFGRNRLLRTVVLLYSVYVVGLILTNALLFFHKMSFSYGSVVDYYLGSESRFLPPRSYQGLLEISHFHLFAMGMQIMVLTHLMLFVPVSNRTKFWLIVVPFVAGLLDEGSSWLVRYAAPEFAWLKLTGFTLLELSLSLLVATAIWATFRGNNQQYRSGETEPTATG